MEYNRLFSPTTVTDCLKEANRVRATPIRSPRRSCCGPKGKQGKQDVQAIKLKDCTAQL